MLNINNDGLPSDGDSNQICATKFGCGVMFRDNLTSACVSLWNYKMRSGLTMLGIAIGVAATITSVAVGMGAVAQIDDRIRSLGANVLAIHPGTARSHRTRLGAGTLNAISENDARAIEEEIGGIAAVAPSVRTGAQIIAGNQNWRTIVNGTTPDYFLIREWDVSDGRFFLPAEVYAADRVALIGETVARQLFGEGASVVGQRIRIRRVPFEIIGVLANKGMSGVGRDQDDIIFIPITTAKQRVIGRASFVSPGAVNYILLKSAAKDLIATIETQVTALLRQRHGLAHTAEDDFRITRPESTMRARNESSRTATWMLAIVASVSLIVGGINVMNTMLAVVADRIREIGVRLAVGGKPSDIRNQFLVEALALSSIGGLIGVGLGFAMSHAIGIVAGWPIVVAPETIGVALFVAGLIGIFFGYFPALRAARNMPMDCLRVR
ncbi:MAG: ABC transporter permease [Alphaproteobacteria bacterium]|nr:ABC transporter permease [Alphaproteobacteria bacterium]